MNAITKTEVDAKTEYATRVAKFRDQMEQQASEVRAALPAHVPLEKFNRVLQTAVTSDPKLLYADRASLWLSAMKCAQDGLLPDGRDAALVRFWDNKNKCERVQYFPMTFGILKKVRNSGEVKAIVARVVYAGDQYRYWIDETGEHLTYEPSPEHDTSVILCVFAMAKTKDDELLVEPLSPAEIEKIRAVSRAKDNGPWKDWWEEMAKKSAIRRLAKRLPMNTDLDDLVRRDDALYDFEGRSDKAIAAAERPRNLIGRLDALAGGVRPSGDDESTHDPETGEITEQAGGDDATADQSPDIGPGRSPSQGGETATANGRMVSPKGAEDAAPRQRQQDAGADDPSVVVGADAPASNSSDDGRPDKAVVMAGLEKAAGFGMDALRKARGALPDAAHELLENDDHNALEAIARKADAATADFPGDRK